MASGNISFLGDVDTQISRLPPLTEAELFQSLEMINSATTGDTDKEEGSDENMLSSSADQSNGKSKDPLTVEQHFKNGKTEKQVIKIVHDRVRRKAVRKWGEVKATDSMKSLKEEVKNHPDIKNSPYRIINVSLPRGDDLESAVKELAIIKLGTNQMKKLGIKKGEKRRMTERRLKVVEQMLKKLDEKEKLEVLAPMAQRLEPIFVDNQKHSALHLKEQVNKVFRGQLTEGAATSRPTGDQGCSQNADSYMLAELAKELFGKKNITVGFSQFPGLAEEVSAAGARKIPESLKPFASKIQETCGGQIAEDAYLNILILMSAAAREMKNCKGFDQFTWDSYMKWAATYNMASSMGLNAQFFKDHLEKLLYPYFCFHFKGGGLGLFL